MSKKTLLTPKFRASFPHLHKAQLNKLSNKEEYSIVALFKKGEDLTALKEAAKAAIVEKWGPDTAKWPKNLRTPFRDQAERTNDDGVLPAGYEAGAIFLNLKSKNRPQVVKKEGKTVIALTDPNDFYAGCWAIASVSVYAYDQAGNRGVAFGLSNVLKVEDGEPLGGRTTPEADFAPIEGAATGTGVTGTDATSLFS